MKLITVENNINDDRIDRYLIDELNLTRNKIQNLIKNKKVSINGKFIKNSYIPKIDDEIKIDDIIQENTEVKPEKMNLDIVYEDEYLLVVNKPNNMVVHPSLGHYTNTLVNGLMYHTKLSNNDSRPGIVHRIDKDTTGLLLVAKNDNVHLDLSKQISEKTVLRKYIALVHNVINHETGTIEAPIGRDLSDRKKMSVTELNSKDAVTHFKVLKKYKKATLIECKLETGRTHQIRVHLNYIGYPIVNDPVYGHNKKINDFNQMLHAQTIGFVHPITKKYLEFESDLPKEFLEILDIYEKE